MFVQCGREQLHRLICSETIQLKFGHYFVPVVDKVGHFVIKTSSFSLTGFFLDLKNSQLVYVFPHKPVGIIGAEAVNHFCYLVGTD